MPDLSPLISAIPVPLELAPLLVGGLAGLGFLLVWLSLSPGRRPQVAADGRLEQYLDTPTAIIDAEVMSRSFTSRVIVPGFRKLLGLLGRIAPKQSVEKTGEMLVQAGHPGGLTILDFFGLRLLGARVVLHHVDDARAIVDGAGGLQDLPRIR